MMASELLRVVLFVLAVGLVYALAGLSLLAMLFGRRRGAPPPRPAILWARRGVLALAGFGLLCMAYGRFIEPYWLEIRHVRIASPRLPAGARPIRIVHVSDLHSDPAPRLEERIPDVVAGEKPDLIVFTGDTINDPDGLPVFRRCMKRLATIAPTFAVTGNWEVRFWPDIPVFQGTGARVLDGEAVRVDVAGSAVWVAGVPAGQPHRIGDVMDTVPPDAFSVFLYHYPAEIEPVAKRGKADLMCAGHTHGGQVALPFYGALVTLSRTGKQYEAGLYRVKGTWLHVSRGIGMEGGGVPRVRFCSRPEVTVIEAGPE
jgi:predicted MPP superfamily phosphohydrolase